MFRRILRKGLGTQEEYPTEGKWFQVEWMVITPDHTVYMQAYKEGRVETVTIKPDGVIISSNCTYTTKYSRGTINIDFDFPRPPAKLTDNYLVVG